MDYGGRSIAGYRIEWAATSGSTWQDAVANTGSDATTRTVTVPAGEVRRFRVRAINSIGTGDPSNVAVSGNAPATGAPAISGSGRVGQMLTASTDGISDANGLTGASYGYRWFHLDGTTETAIAGATSAAYMPLPADLGTRIGVRADFTDDGGFAETLASAAVTIRAAMPPAACPAASLGDRTEVWSGTVTVGVAPLEVDGVPTGYGYFGGSSGLDPKFFDLGTPTTRYTVDLASVINLGATTGSFLFSLDKALTAGQAGSLRLHVCGETYAFSDATYVPSGHHYTWPTAGLDWSGLEGMPRILVVSARANAAATGAPAVSGTARVGATVTASTAGIRDADGLAGVTYAYRWLRVDGSVETEISGATGRTYTLAADDAGKRVKVRVSFSDAAMNEEGPLDSPAFPMTGTIAMAPPPMDPSDLLSATLTVKNFSTYLGCGSGSETSTVSCKNTAVLTARGFTVPGTTATRNIDRIDLRPTGNLTVDFDGSFTDAQKAVLAIEFGTTRLNFSDATYSGNDARWTGTGLGWSAGDSVTVKVINDPGDTTPPELILSASLVNSHGENLPLVFSEVLDNDNLPPLSAFTVDGRRQPGHGDRIIGRWELH